MLVVEEHTFDPGDLLRTSKDKQVGLRWPMPLDDRLDKLVDRAVTAGERTNRKELLAALLATVDLSGEQLGLALKRYRTMKVAEAMLDRDEPAGNVVHLEGRKPGPRARET